MKELEMVIAVMAQATLDALAARQNIRRQGEWVLRNDR